MGLTMGTSVRKVRMDCFRRPCALLALALLGLVLLGGCEAAPREFGYPVIIPVLNENNEADYIVQHVQNLRDLFRPEMIVEEKRGIDFGLGRGYSGSQAARHMLGLQQASFAGGPGKRSV